MVAGGARLTFGRYLTPILSGRIAKPVDNLIVILIVLGAIAAFMLVTAWLSLDRNKLLRVDHSAAE